MSLFLTGLVVTLVLVSLAFLSAVVMLDVAVFVVRATDATIWYVVHHFTGWLLGGARRALEW